MGIKPEADRYFIDNEQERDIATRLDEVFDITFRNTFGGLSFWLAEPKKQTKERFGIQQEVLVIYSPHWKTDARVLTSIENITRSPDFKHRVEKVLFFLIHKGSPEETASLLNASVDRIIIPVHIDELTNSKRGTYFLRSKIARTIGSIDLFGMTSAITSDKYFFGRNELVQSLITRSTIRKENSGLFGLRKTGKTSVLRAIQRRIESRSILAEYLECSNPGIHAARWWQVLENILNRFTDTLKRDFKKDIKVEGNYSRENAGTKFSSDVKEILRNCNLDQIIIMLDEIEFITCGISGTLGQHWDQDFIPFWQTIRSTHQETQGGLTFLVAGVNPACMEMSHFAGIPNPIFQLALPHFLEPFTTPQVREMVRSIGKYAGLHFDEDVFSYLQSTYGGHPFLIRVACSEIWKTSDKLNPEKLMSIKIKDFQHLQTEIKSRLAAPIKDILLSLVWWYPEEYDLLRIIASGDREFVNDYIKQEQKSILKFAQYGLLMPGSTTEFAIADLKDFLNTYGDTYKNDISPFTRSDMPPQLLPEIPDLAKLGHLFEKRTQIEIKLRTAIMLYLNVKFTFDSSRISQSIIKGLPRRRDRHEPKDLFVGRLPQEVLNQLYILDLKTIIITNWEVFAPLFNNNKQRFEMNMDTLNIARRADAHTKPITTEEARDFENSYSWLLSHLSKIPQ